VVGQTALDVAARPGALNVLQRQRQRQQGAGPLLIMQPLGTPIGARSPRLSIVAITHWTAACTATPIPTPSRLRRQSVACSPSVYPD